MAEIDRQHMRRAIALAKARLGSTWPNPTVGCVIADGDRVLAEAVTGPGGPDSAAARLHAEEQALIAAGAAASGATAYVTLEPCAERSSNRPSCSDRLVEASCARVVVACEDPSPRAAGRGLARLKAAGLAVEIGVLADEAAGLYVGYHRLLATGRPLIEVADNGYGFDAQFNPEASEDLSEAMMRFGSLGYTRMWVEPHSALADLLRQRQLLD
jgi:diaminohydroxyphosphoribosylaminopyrimidine deaminase/5-amino-6-(5-phosphoribosylamino)uracil reductase